MSAPSARSKAELLKERSRHLRGAIQEELRPAWPGFSKETVQILKFHGVFQQADRDARRAGSPPEYSLAVRVAVPGGILSAEQYLAMDRLADEAADGRLRITTRQDVEFHHVRKTDLRPLLSALNETGLSTLGGCGDVVRNVVCCPAPGPLWDQLYGYVRALSQRFRPQTRAYEELWLDQAPAAGQPAAEQPAAEYEQLYGAAYLPRKFKIGIAAAGDNCIDVYTNDMGIVPIYGGRGLEGFTLLAGGGLGMSPGVRATRPRLADPLCTVEPAQLEQVVEAIVRIHRDCGNRADRRLARLKYLVADWGIDRFKQELEERLGRTLPPPKPLSWVRADDHLGWHFQTGDLRFMGIRMLSGQVEDHDGAQLRTGLRAAVERFRPGVRLTPQQNILLTGLRGADRAPLEALLRCYGIQPAEQLPPVVRHALACPALPACGLAITEAERVLPAVLREIQAELDDLGLGRQPLRVRVAGCANSCARPNTAEIGLVCQSLDLYGIYLGGSPMGTRLGFLFAKTVPRTAISSRLRPVFQLYRESRQEGEAFGDFCHRRRADVLRMEQEAAAQPDPQILTGAIHL